MRALNPLPYNKVLWKIRGVAKVVYRSKGILNKDYMLGFCLGPFIAIHKSAKDMLNVWHHELGHAIINTHYKKSNYLNRRENEAFACIYEYLHFLYHNVEEYRALSIDEMLGYNAIDYVVSKGLESLKIRMKHGKGKKGYKHLKRYKLRTERLHRALRFVIKNGWVCDDNLPKVNGWSIINPWNNRRWKKH